MERELRPDPRDPQRRLCPRCRRAVLLVTVADRKVAVDFEIPTDEEPPAGLYVGLSNDGSTRPLRLPTELRRRGESLHVPHELSCDG